MVKPDPEVIEILVWRRDTPFPGAKLAAYWADGYIVGKVTFELVRPVPKVRAGPKTPSSQSSRQLKG